MEKEHQPDSMATITMKAEYPPSEVYSTSEPPPAYRMRPSNSVQIARIVALTVVATAFILGAFILASSWVAARSSCHQLEQLDAMLDKELALEGRPYGNDALVADEPLPSDHALHGMAPPRPPQTTAPPPVDPAPTPKEDALTQAESKVDEDKLQKIDDDNSKGDGSEENSDSDSSAEEDDDLDAIKPMLKLPVQFNLDELAGAFLANNEKGRMNCVVERRRDDPMERRFPFNILGAFAPLAPRSAHAERVAIICKGGNEAEPRPPMGFPEPQSQVFAFPLSGPVRLPLRPSPERPAPPAPHAPRMSPFEMRPLSQHRPGPFPLPMPWDSSEEQMGGPREMRIHVQRVIAIPAGPSPHNMPPPEVMGNAGPFAPPPAPQQQPRDQNEQPTVLHQFVPQSAPTQELEQPEIQKVQMEGAPMQMGLPWGLLPEDLQVIHRAAEDAQQRQMRDRDQQMDNDMQEVKTIVHTLAAAAEAEAEAQAQAEAHAQAQAEAHAQAQAQAQAQAEEQHRQEMQQQQQQQQQQEQQQPEQEQELPAQEAPAQAPRAPRTLLIPQDMTMDGRPHYMQPRSVRSLDAPLH